MVMVTGSKPRLPANNLPDAVMIKELVITSVFKTVSNTIVVGRSNVLTHFYQLF